MHAAHLSIPHPKLTPHPKLILSNMSPLSLMIALVSLLRVAAAYNMPQWSTGRATHSGGEISSHPAELVSKVCRVLARTYARSLWRSVRSGTLQGNMFQSRAWVWHVVMWVSARSPDQSEGTDPQKVA